MEQFKSEDIVIFVHGTFANTESGWTSIEDDFHRKLNIEFKKITGYHFNSFSYIWSGLNSLAERQSAGILLAETINVYHERYKRIHLIGHSHGGSVIQFAIQKSSFLVSDRWKLKLASWTTIGTPFYRYTGKLKLTDKQLFMFSMPLSVIITLGIVLIVYSFGILNKWVYIGVYIIVFQFISKYLDGKSLQFRLDRVNRHFAQKWFGIYSMHDEAIAGLRNSLSFELKSNKKKFPTFDGETDIVTHGRKLIATLSYNVFPKKWIFSKLSSKLRNISLGIDKAFYSVKDVNFKPIDEVSAQEMPTWLEEDLYNVVISDNINKIDELRRLLNINRTDMFETVNNLKESQKPLLIHSHYFKHQAVIQTIANHIANRIKQFNKENSR